MFKAVFFILTGLICLDISFLFDKNSFWYYIFEYSSFGFVLLSLYYFILDVINYAKVGNEV